MGAPKYVTQRRGPQVHRLHDPLSSVDRDDVADPELILKEDEEAVDDVLHDGLRADARGQDDQCDQQRSGDDLTEADVAQHEGIPCRLTDQAPRTVSSVISGGALRRNGGPVVPTPRLT